MAYNITKIAEMNINIRPWQLSDVAALAAVINNKNVQDNLRDGLPYPYTEKDGEDFIVAMLNAEFAFAVTADDKVVGSIGAIRQANIHLRTKSLKPISNTAVCRLLPPITLGSATLTPPLTAPIPRSSCVMWLSETGSPIKTFSENSSCSWPTTSGI
jgi:hypothetical protein